MAWYIIVDNVIWDSLVIIMAYHWAPAQRFRLVSYNANRATTSCMNWLQSCSTHLLTTKHGSALNAYQRWLCSVLLCGRTSKCHREQAFLHKKLICGGTIEEIKAKESSPFRRPAEALTNDVTKFIQFPVFFQAQMSSTYTRSQSA